MNDTMKLDTSCHTNIHILLTCVFIFQTISLIMSVLLFLLGKCPSSRTTAPWES